MTEKKSLLTFPTEFTIKTFGKMGVEFETVVLSIITKHVSDLREDAIQTRPSANNKFLSMSITFIAESQTQLDAIYVELTASPEILMTL